MASDITYHDGNTISSSLKASPPLSRFRVTSPPVLCLWLFFIGQKIKLNKYVSV